MRCPALAALALALTGCGWSRGLSVPEGGHGSVGVEIFRTERNVIERGLEAELHAELSRAVSDLVGARLVAPEDADWVVRGTIQGFRRRGGIRSQDNELLETALEIDLEAVLVARGRAGAPAASRTDSATRVWSGFALDVPENEPAARQRALRYLAETIVLELFAEPPPEPLAAPLAGSPG